MCNVCNVEPFKYDFNVSCFGYKIYNVFSVEPCKYSFNMSKDVY